MEPALDIILVNWNSGRQLFDCLKSVEGAIKEAFRLTRVVVVDNASGDGSLSDLDTLSIPLQVLQNQTNRGFGAACNQGAEESFAEYLLFLNPDSQLQSNSLDTAIRFMDNPENAAYGICGIRLLDEQGNTNRHSSVFPRPSHFWHRMLGLDKLFPRRFPGHILEGWDHCDSREVDHVIGAFYLVRKEVFERLKGFDERFFVYLEDLDFSLRAKKAGFRTFYLAEAVGEHRAHGSSDQVRAARLYYSLRSRLLYGFKHFGFISAVALAFGTLFVEPLTRATLAIIKGSASTVFETAAGYALLWKSFAQPPNRRTDKS